jgi:rhamnogalacturonyl hydrolase YesR
MSLIRALLVSTWIAGLHLLKTSAAARPTSDAVWAADSIMSRGQGHGLDSSNRLTVSYEHGEFQWALRLLYERTGNKTYFDYIQSGVDNIVTSNGTVQKYAISDYTLDPVRVGPTFIYL